MIVKIVTLFLIAIAVLAMFGRLKLRLPGRDRLTDKKCPRCGRFRIGKGPCPCKGGHS
ncbi:short-chain dehydrogenase [Marinibacterium profundimaris]|uniref:Short-chain dehydrogenase n=1 Tax=Marinibacterium profundimaris TaxID=1679460 RepID=A0A225NMJ8_9RHOB|nr:short-chain dehydrogenase [Marinibacterium profundimaris]